jgi:hypothetical protein
MQKSGVHNVKLPPSRDIRVGRIQDKTTSHQSEREVVGLESGMKIKTEGTMQVQIQIQMQAQPFSKRW